jgi:putative ABC transport system permease protein
MGIRIALGALRYHIVRTVVGHGARLIAIGVALGLAASIAVSVVLSSVAAEMGVRFGGTAIDPVIFGVVSLLLVTVAGLACYVPARKVARVDPIQALKYD